MAGWPRSIGVMRTLPTTKLHAEIRNKADLVVGMLVDVARHQAARKPATAVTHSSGRSNTMPAPPENSP